MSDSFYSFECTRCLATYTGKPHELPKLGWVRHAFGERHSRGDVWLCKECSEHFEAIWKAREAA